MINLFDQIWSILVDQKYLRSAQFVFLTKTIFLHDLFHTNHVKKIVPGRSKKFRSKMNWPSRKKTCFLVEKPNPVERIHKNISINSGCGRIYWLKKLWQNGKRCFFPTWPIRFWSKKIWSTLNYFLVNDLYSTNVIKLLVKSIVGH